MERGLKRYKLSALRENFGTIANPLTVLLSKEAATFECGQPQEEGFETLKKALITPPILADPTSTKNSSYSLTPATLVSVHNYRKSTRR